MKWGLAHPALMLALVLACLVGSVALFIVSPKGFFPEQDTGRLIGSVVAEQDVSFQTMEVKLREIVNIVMTDPDVEHVAAFTGASGGGATTNTGRMFIALKPHGQRKATAQQVIGCLRARLARIPGAPTFLQVMQELRVGGRLTGGMYQYTLTGEDLKLIETWSPRLLNEMRKLPSAVDVNSDQQNKGLEVRLDINRKTASRLGITPKMLDDILYDAFGQRQVSISYTSLNQYRTIMEFQPSFWQRPESLQQVYVQSTSGAMVPLSAFSSFTRSWASLAVNHQAQFPAVTFSFNLPQGRSLGQAVKDVENAARAIHMPAGLRGSFQGTAQVFQSALANMPWLIFAALIAVYIVLGILYESYVHPLTILSTLPSAGVGALLALLIFHIDFSIISPDRYYSPHWSRKKERDHDGRFRSRGRAHARKKSGGSNIPGVPFTFSADHDDDHGCAFRRSAPRCRYGHGF
jgi:multidrug efflux pump subunit AcrB